MGFDIVMAEPWKILFSLILVLSLGFILLQFTSSMSSVVQSAIDSIINLLKNTFIVG